MRHTTTASTGISEKRSAWPVLFSIELCKRGSQILHHRCQDAVHSPVQGPQSAAVAARALLCNGTSSRSSTPTGTKTTGPQCVGLVDKGVGRPIFAQCVVLYDKSVAYNWDIVRINTSSAWSSWRSWANGVSRRQGRTGQVRVLSCTQSSGPGSADAGRRVGRVATGMEAQHMPLVITPPSMSHWTEIRAHVAGLYREFVASPAC